MSRLSAAALALALALALVQPAQVVAQTDYASGIAQQETSLQNQITEGLNSGSLSASQVEALEQRLQNLQVGTGSAGSLGRVGTPAGETLTPLGMDGRGLEGGSRQIGQAGIGQNGTGQAGTVGNASRTPTGPDPFTYNTLGPDAYQSQKYQNPEYNVPAYPTTNPTGPGISQQYSQPSAGYPYGAGYSQAPGAGANGAGGGVFVYKSGSGR